MPPAGAPRGSPTQTRRVFLRFVGEGTTPLIKGRWPEGPEGIGNCPSRRISEISPYLAGHSGPGPCDKGRMTSGYTVGAAISRPKAFPLPGGRCRAHAGRMRVGSGIAGTPQRAGQCPSPAKGRNGFRVRRRGAPMCPSAGDGFPQCRAGAEGESAEGREKPPWGVPPPRSENSPPVRAVTAALTRKAGRPRAACWKWFRLWSRSGSPRRRRR